MRKTRPPFGMLEGYASWTSASARILRRPSEVAAERRFATELQTLVFPYGLPNGNRPLWSRLVK